MNRGRMVRAILEGLRCSRTVCVVGHVRPDGDCIGSQLALALALQDQGKQVTCWNEDRVPAKFAFLDPHRMIRPPVRGRRFDCVVATDSASFERLGKAGRCIGNRRLFINIDHHISNTGYADLNWVSAREPSTGELIYHLLKAARWPVTPPLADCLFTAISTDTGSFQYPSTRPGTLAVAGELIRRGANLARICAEVYQSYSLARVRLLKHLYRHFCLAHDNQIAYCRLTQADYARAGAAADESEGLIDHLRAIAPVVVACIFEQTEPGLTRVSLRSKTERVNVGEIAARFGGGGHPAAAGARVGGHPASVQRRVLHAIKQALRRISSGPRRQSPAGT